MKCHVVIDLQDVHNLCEGFFECRNITWRPCEICSALCLSNSILCSIVAIQLMIERDVRVDFGCGLLSYEATFSLKMEAVGSSEIFIAAYKFTPCHNPLDHYPVIHLR
jgi:hypothetical protein